VKNNTFTVRQPYENIGTQNYKFSELLTIRLLIKIKLTDY